MNASRCNEIKLINKDRSSFNNQETTIKVQENLPLYRPDILNNKENRLGSAAIDV